MLQVRCPSCRRLLDVPAGTECVAARCPACDATFVPETITTIRAGGASEATEITATPGGRPRRFGPTRQQHHPRTRRNSDANWRLAKWAFWVALIARAATSLAQEHQRDGLFVDLLFAPVFALFVAVIVVLVKGTFLGWDRRAGPTGFEWIVWPFAIGSVFAGGAILLGALGAGASFGESIGPALVLAPFAGLLIALATFWLTAAPGQFRQFFYKMRQAGRPEADFLVASSPADVSSQPQHPACPPDAFTERPVRGPDTAVTEQLRRADEVANG